MGPNAGPQGLGGGGGGGNRDLAFTIWFHRMCLWCYFPAESILVAQFHVLTQWFLCLLSRSINYKFS